MIVGPTYGTPEWRDFRRGLVTATGFGTIMTDSTKLTPDQVEAFAHLVAVPRFKELKSGPNKGKEVEVPGFGDLVRQAMESQGIYCWGRGAVTYMRELIAATITGEDKAGGRSVSMERGVDKEIDAIDDYARKRFLEVGEGRILRMDDTIIAATPDGFVDDDKEGPGLLEVKCPNSDTQLDYYWNRGNVPDEYRWQVQGQLWVSGRAWCDFISYDDRFPDPIRVVHVRARRDEVMIQMLDSKVRAFAKVVEERVAELRAVIAAATPEQVETIMDALTEEDPERDLLPEDPGPTAQEGLGWFHED